MKRPLKQKSLLLDEELCEQLEMLCDVMNTNFATKTKDLLMEWKIRELKRLKDDAPDMYEDYLSKTAKTSKTNRKAKV